MVESIRKNFKGILLMLLSSGLICIGQLLWKFYSMSSDLKYLLLGFMLYGFGALFMLIAYRYGSLSVLQPILCMNYIISLFLGTAFLQESITIIQIIGVMIIIIGILFIVGGDS